MPTDGFAEAVRYYRNARELLGRCKVEDNRYEYMKPVRESFGTAWLAFDHAAKVALIQSGVDPKKMPRTWDALLAEVRKRLDAHNGKLVRLLSDAYQVVHIAGYYHGEFRFAPLAKDGLQVVRQGIGKLSGRRIG
ncbi:MAG: DUF5618 family protein [Nitrospirae bacterium]|nr:DUF5618 family protein [Nitrospirota bacterium]